MSTPKILAILLAILLAIAGIDYVQSRKAQKQAATADLLIKGFEPSELTGFHYRSTNTTPTTEFTAKKTPSGFMITSIGGTIQPESATQSKANDRAIEAMAELFATTKYSRSIASKDPSEFGLDNPAVTLGFQTPSTGYTLHIGNRTPSSYARYAAIAGRPEVYVISDTLYMAADKKLIDFRDRRIISVPLAQLGSIRYSKTKYPPITSRKKGTRTKRKAEQMAVTMTRQGQLWYLDSQNASTKQTDTKQPGKKHRGSSTTITDLVTTLNSLEALRIVDKPSAQLLKAYGIEPGSAPRGRGLKQLIQLEFQLTGAKAEHGSTTALTLVERDDSLIAYTDPTVAISFLAPKTIALLAIDDFSYRKVFDLDAPSSIDFASIHSVHLGSYGRSSFGRGSSGSSGSGTFGSGSRQYHYILDPKSKRWLPASGSSGSSGLSSSGLSSGGLSPVDIKALLIDLEFANAIRSYASSSELPAGYDASPKVKVSLEADTGATASADAKGASKATLEVTIARLAESDPPVAIISYEADEGKTRFYEVSPATVRSIRPLLQPPPD